MTVALPDGAISSSEMYYIDKGGVLRGALGGPDQRLDRLGSRWGISCTTRPMKGDEARIWIARLVRGVSEKVSLKLPQPGIVNELTVDAFQPAPGSAANAINIHVTAAVGMVGKKLKEGQFVALVNNQGILFRCVHQVIADATFVNVGGAADIAALQLNPPTRASYTNMPVEVVAPRIEGFVKNESWRWTIDNAKIYGLTFSIDEAR